MARRTATTAAMLAVPILSEVVAASRTPVPGGQGCYTIQDRAACCLFTDGREGTDYGGQDCVPAQDGVSFDVGLAAAGPVCQPSCWASGKCGSVDQSALIGACPKDSALLAARASRGLRQVLPRGFGCDAVTDTAACCAFLDGRGHYEGQECVPARGDAYFQRPGVVCQASCTATGACGGPDLSPYAGFCAAPQVKPLPSTALVAQSGARVAVGGDLRFYVVGSSNAAWQNWPDQMHSILTRMGYAVKLPSTGIPGETDRPTGRRTPKCADAEDFEPLRTPRLALQGWSTWGFAYESEDDCDDAGFRNIAGWNVSCTNGWACNAVWRGTVPLVPPSAIARGVRGAHVVVLANFVNDGRNAMYCPHSCYGSGAVPDVMDTTEITAESLKRTIRAIHAEDPEVVVLVLGRYADAKNILFVDAQTLDRNDRINAAVKEKLEMEPNSHFVDVTFPLDVSVFQTLNSGHANCRGDMVMANSVIEAMYKHGVIAKGLDLGDEHTCLARSDCGDLDVACCQRSALCYVNAEGVCAPYGPGLQ